MPLNVLLAGGAEPSILHAFAKATLELAGGGDVLTTPGPFRRAHEIDEVRALTRQHDIGLVVPMIDDDLPLWAALAGSFAAEGTHVAISPASTVAMCHDRHVLCRSLNLMGIAATASWLPSQVSRDLPMPLVVVGRIPRHAIEPVQVQSYPELNRLLTAHPDAVVQTRLDGPEFEVHVSCDLDGRLLRVAPSEYAELALCVTSAVRFAGPVTIFGTLAGDRPMVRAVSPRMSSSATAGVFLPAALVEMALERRSRVSRYGAVSAAMGAVA